MSRLVSIHPEDPQERLIKQVVEVLRAGGLIAYPTDSGYALGCCLGERKAVESMRTIRQLDKNHHFTLVCRDLSELAVFAKVDNAMFRVLKNNVPGAYTFILPATREVPRLVLHPKKREVGLRVPANNIAQAILAELGEPLASASLILPGETMPMLEPWEIKDTIGHQLDLVVDGGFCGMEATTVVDCTGEVPEIVRHGAGDPTPFE
ncbi:L-threonylcarbamoyladenylate synthase [Salinibius halmophilus]|uniref:L-threonylcarbamoyladenylate synthase n=1 Tax=Salinibius halmophilus TaxID=1853216 RepID=UPI000E669F6E|nr:L-threonylcarbamoyladenylate synthase [Salinibius halmophilus]